MNITSCFHQILTLIRSNEFCFGVLDILSFCSLDKLLLRNRICQVKIFAVSQSPASTNPLLTFLSNKNE